MKTMRLAASVLVLALLVSGCMAGQMSGMMPGQMPGMSGLIYTHAWEPLTLDMDHTAMGPASGAGDIKHLAVRMMGVAWDSAAIGDIAQKQGLKELYFADLETFSILHVWNQYTVHVYGK